MAGPAQHRYLLALGSNMRHRAGAPAKVIGAAVEALGENGAKVLKASPIIETSPVGHSRRRFANACVSIETRQAPPEMLETARKIELAFGRKRMGIRWGRRVLDVDLILWSGGAWHDPRLVIPHPEFRKRDFVLGPATAIAADWRDPVTGLSVAQLYARLTQPRPVPR